MSTKVFLRCRAECTFLYALSLELCAVGYVWLKVEKLQSCLWKAELKQRQRRSILCEMTAEEDIPSSFARSVPPSFSLIYINNWGLSRKDTWCGSESGAQRILVPLLLWGRLFLCWYDMNNTGGLTDCLFVNFLPATVILLVDEILTLCPGSRWVLPGWPTTKWTSAISSLLNITEFLKRERNNKKTGENEFCIVYSVHVF